jgi:hypothetical protein
MVDGFDKEKKYYGEVWFVENEDERQFCVMSFNGDKIWLETNLHSKKRQYKETQILGTFTGVGYFIFIDCRIQHSSSGIIETRIYKPKYTFVSSTYFINTKSLKIKEFRVVNDAITNWVGNSIWYSQTEEKLHKTYFNDIYEITKRKLQINIEHYQNFKMEKQSTLKISNRGAVKFKLENSVTILEAIGLYDQFQKVLQLVHGRSAKFKQFCFKCIGCGEWQDLYYDDTKLTKSNFPFVHSEYEKIKSSLNIILNASFTDSDFQFCLDRLMENFIGNHSSHNKRFTNSISAYEAYYKTYSKIGEISLKKRISENATIFKLIGDFQDEKWKYIPAKIVRARNYHIYSNPDNKEIYSELELLYLSFLFDYTTTYLLLSEIGNIQNHVLDNYISQGKSTFVDMQRTNTILGSNLLI